MKSRKWERQKALRALTLNTLRLGTAVSLWMSVGCGDDVQSNPGNTATTGNAAASSNAGNPAGGSSTGAGGGPSTSAPGVKDVSSAPATSSGVTSSSTTSTGSSAGGTPECEAGKIRCGLNCIDPNVDSDYCGASGDCIGPNSGRACPGAEQCSAGSCACQTGWVRCKGACINPKEDEAFCGAKLDCLGANAGLSCGANRVCEDGACKSGCKANEVLCDGVCINPKNDFNYCGAKNSCSGSDAGKTCSIGQVCSDGSCKLQCKTGEVLCNNRCVNPLLDNAFCGATGDCSGSNAGANCQAPESCVDGTCGLYCNDWQTKCEGKCVNGQSDPSYCGAPAKSDCVGPNKGVKCANNEICSRGQCVQAGCEEADFSVNLPKSDVMLVLDKSASMSLEQIADGASTKTRWVVLHEVVEQLLTDYKDKVRFGLKLFPAKEVPVADPCLVDPGVDVEISESSNNDILGKMPARTATVTGRTPTATGFIRASTHAISVSARSDNPTAIMLIADGQMSLDSAPPTERCEGQTEDILKTEADKARSQGVSVYSVGIALAGAGRTLLTEVAGGAENYVQADNKAQLRAAMESILAKVPNCKVPINTVPQYHELMKVRTSDGSSSFDAPWQYQYADCSAVAAANLTRGYVYTKRSGPYDEIELCGDSCKDYKKTASVDIKQNCPPPP